jgi:hypothetical protein
MIKLTTAQAVTDFLPSGSTARALSAGTLTNPGSSYSNVLAGQVAALSLSVGFDNAIPSFGSSSQLLKDLFIQSGVFTGWSVQRLLDEANKKLLFYPDNLQMWSSAKPIWMCGLGSRCVYHLSGEKLMGSSLLSWIQEREREGFKFRWPLADGKLDDLKSRAELLKVKITVDKPKKDDYCVLVGRAETIQHLLTEFSNGPTS